MGELLPILIIIYLICHLPAIIMLILGVSRMESNPEGGRKLLIAAGIYFVIGGGICGALIL